MTYTGALQRVRQAPRREIPGGLRLAPVLLVPLAISGPNALIGLYGCAVLAAGLRLLWRPGEPPILLFIFLYQWLQSSIGAFYGNAVGVSLADIVPFGGQHDVASGLMLTGTLVLALSMRAAVGKPTRDLHAVMKAFVGRRPFNFWLRIYVVTWVFSALCAMIAPSSSGLRLPLLTLSEVKWAGFVLLTFAAFSGPLRSARTVWLMVFAVEFVLSIGGFFANFKQVFFYALFGLATCNLRFGARLLVPGAVLGMALLLLALVWTAIKGDYRTFVNAGTRQQVVIVDYGARIQELGRLIGELDARKLQDASDRFFTRLMYHHFFGVSVTNVPETIPYTGGEIWGEAIARPFMPRLLFPEKREIHDSELTNQYTGLGVATADQGTSISLGYMAEAYIDFGPVLMFAAIAGLGAGLGWFYGWLLRQSGFMAVVGAALAPFALMPAHLAESSILKMISSLVLSMLVCFVVLWVLAPMLIGRLTAPRQSH